MNAIRKKLCAGAFAGVEAFSCQTIARRCLLKSSADVLGRDSTRQAAHAVDGSGVCFAKWYDDGAVSWVRGSATTQTSRKLVSLVGIEGLQIGGLRKMGVTTRPSDRAAEHGVRSPLPFGDDSAEKIEERRQDEFLRAARNAAASKVEQVEEAVGEQVGASFEPTDAEIRGDMGRASADLVHEEASEFTVRSESHSVGTHSAPEKRDDDDTDSGIDEEVQRGLIADSKFPVGRVVEKSSPPGDDEGLVTGSLGDDDLGYTESVKGGKNKYKAV
ncbi:hypothetical protein R1flu_023655 [Riccia fluitans]|uniref:Uncharacterized protein n=1 Tax=Riccia fluitans TaxID=41844 RepID=A0ABD1XSN0_9MARC